MGAYFRRTFAALCAGLVVAVAGCAPSPASPENPFVSLCEDPIVVDCGHDAWPAGITVAADAATGDVLAFTARVRGALTDAQRENSQDAIVPPEVTLRADDPDAVALDPEVAPAPKWQFTVRPGESDDALAGVLEAAAVPGASGISAGLGWPSAVAATLSDVEPLIRDLSSTSLFADGGTFTVPSLDEHFRLVYVPAYTTMDGVRAVVSVARDYPDAEVLLEAPTAGPNQPTFYVARLSADEATQLAARLSEPAMASASVEGVPLEFVLTSRSEQGTTSITGTFGGAEG
ncbi:MAG: hypothetical protein PIR02_05115 [Microbacterium enclense]